MTVFHAPIFFAYFCSVNQSQALFDLLIQRTRREGPDGKLQRIKRIILNNNNPLNIRRSKDQWQGMKKTQSDSSFCQFETFEDGWRAAFVLLTRTYYHKYRLYTIVSVKTGISYYKVDLKALDRAYSVAFPKSTSINVNKK